MAKLVDALDSGSSDIPCRFKSCHLHQNKTKSKLRSRFSFFYATFLVISTSFFEMQLFSIKKRNGDKITGVGYITDEDLLIPAISKNNKPYIRVFEDCIKDCHKIVGKDNQYQGIYEYLMNADLEDEKGRITTKEITVTYYIWFMTLED